MVEAKLVKVEEVPNCYRVIIVDESGQICKAVPYSVVYDVETVELVLKVVCEEKGQGAEFVTIRF